KAEQFPDERIVILEDTIELQCNARNSVALRTTDTVNMQRLLRATMRLRPDSIVVGEVRGSEALDFIKALNTGHDGGLCTLHANSTRSALTRLEQLVAEVTTGYMRAVIAEAIDVIVAIVKTKTSRAVKEIVRVNRFEAGEYVLSKGGIDV